MTKEQIKALLKTSEALKSLEIEQGKQWEYIIWNEDLSTIKYIEADSNGYGVQTDNKPSDFPADSVINARITAMHNLVDAGKTYAEVMATTSW